MLAILLNLVLDEAEDMTKPENIRKLRPIIPIGENIVRISSEELLETLNALKDREADKDVRVGGVNYDCYLRVIRFCMVRYSV